MKRTSMPEAEIVSALRRLFSRRPAVQQFVNTDSHLGQHITWRRP